MACEAIAIAEALKERQEGIALRNCGANGDVIQ